MNLNIENFNKNELKMAASVRVLGANLFYIWKKCPSKNEGKMADNFTSV